MATAKILLYKSKQKADGTYPIVLRIIHNQKLAYTYLDWIDEEDWDIDKQEVKRRHPHSIRLNLLIADKKRTIREL